MKISDFAKEVCKLEGKKINLPIGQVLEVLKIINKMTEGRLYKYIRSGDSKLWIY